MFLLHPILIGSELLCNIQLHTKEFHDCSNWRWQHL